MFSLLNFTLLAAENTEYRLFTGMPPIFGVPSELLLPVVLAILAMVAGYYYGESIRMKDHGWRVGIIAASFLASLAIVLFWEYKLGVDLKGGAILVYEVDELSTAANHPQGRGDDWKMADLMQVLARRLNPDGLKDIVIRPFGPKQVEIVVPEVDEDEVNLIKKKVIEAGVLRFLILADGQTRDRNLWDAARNQIDNAPSLAAKLSRNVQDPSDEKRIIGVWVELGRKASKNPGNVEEVLPFAAEGAAFGTLLRNGETGDLLDMAGRLQDEDPATYFHRRNIKKVEVLMVNNPDIDIRGSDLATASEGFDETGSPAILFTMKSDGAGKMGEVTTDNKPQGSTTRKLGIVWDNRLVSSPSIQSTISSRGQITGFSQREVREKVELLRSGSMPVVLYQEPISDDRIGATLGLDTVRKGSQAIMISLAIVFGFVMFYYRAAGFIACFALLLNMLLTVAIMFALKAPFTLPGLAGLVLTVGMSVDANVLIYERIREELERGAALRMAIRNGFDKALATIIDSNVTTLLTAVILYIIGTDQVRGFGMTLILGILTSMFTAIFCSRAILEIGERAYRWTTLSMLKLFNQTNIDWMSTLRPAAVVSIVLIIVGLAATIYRGTGIFDIDMAGGTTVQFILDSKVHPTITEEQIRQRLNDEAKGYSDEKGAAVLNIYQKFLAQSAGAADQQSWKVDCSLQDIDKLKELVRKAFREGDREGLQSYGLSIGTVNEIQPTEPAKPTTDAPKTETPGAGFPKVETNPVAPKTETPKTEETDPKPETPKAETPKGEGDKTEPAKPETPKADAPKADADKPAKPEDSADCQPAEDTKKSAEQPKSEQPKSEESKDPKPDETKPSDPKPADPKPEQPKTETPEPPKPETTPPVTPSATPDNDPSKLIPVAPPLGPIRPATGGNIVKSEVHLTLGNTKITGSALQEKIEKAAEKAIGQSTLADVNTPGWNRVDNKSYSEWDVTLALPKADAEKVLTQLEADLAAEPVWQTSSKIGGQVSENTRWRAFGAVVGSIIGMIIYMWIRFHKISWGIAAAVALAHDALVMLGAIAVSIWLAPFLGFLQVEEFKISLPVVAAFLTLIGYSVNDTIVIFDRIREIRGKSPDVTGQMINDAVNQTLSRTFLTAGTTLGTITILYFLGGSGIHAFAFALVIGVISGTYSTIFIASPLLLYMIGLDHQQAKGKNVSVPSTEKTRGAA